MKRKVRKFSTGGDYESSDDAKNLVAAAAREAAEANAPKATPTPTAEPLKMASFGEAFKEARGRGDKTFEYMGKKYTTDMAGAKKPAAASTPKAAAPAAKSSTPSTTPKSGSYADAAKSSRTLGDVLSASSDDREKYMKDVREGKTKTLGTRFQEGLRRFGRAISTGRPQVDEDRDMKKGGKVKSYKSGGSVKSSASSRADGIAQRGKTRGRMV